jgi:hypothetical protein
MQVRLKFSYNFSSSSRDRIEPIVTFLALPELIKRESIKAV